MKKTSTLLAMSLCMLGAVQAQEIVFPINPNPEWMVQGETVKGKGMTMYSGEQEFNCLRLEDGSYTLIDPERKLYTLDGSYQALLRNGLSWAKLAEMGEIMAIEEMEEELGNELSIKMAKTLISTSGLYLNSSAEWLDQTFEPKLDSIRYCIDNPEGSKVPGHSFYINLYEVNKKGQPEKLIASSDTVLFEGNGCTLHLNESCKPNKTMLAAIYVIDKETGKGNELATLPTKISHNADISVLSSIQVPQSEEELKKQEADKKQNGYLLYLNTAVGYTPMIDVHWGMTKVLDYYKNTFGLDSFDGMGSPIYCLVNQPVVVNPSDNSAAVLLTEGEPGLMMLGLGGPNEKGGLGRPYTILPIIGHEFTHLVCRNLRSFKKDTQDSYPNALNESFADIMGFAINRAATGKESWIMGDEMGLNNRRFDNPEKGMVPCPSCYLDKNFDTKTFEEHTNSTVQSHMFYLLVKGGKGKNSLKKNYNVTPMDITEAEFLAFNTVRDYTFAGMSYPDAANAWYKAARDIYGAGSAQQQSVWEAWAAVGITIDASGIERMTSDEDDAARSYNLMGMPVEGEQGFVVKNGRVILKK